MEQRVRQFKWNANDYANNASAQYSWAKALISKLELTGDEIVLDIGCGNGRISAELAGQLPTGEVFGIDASDEMIDCAHKAYPTKHHPNLRFARMDAKQITCSKQFDIVFSNAALHWVDDHLAVLKGIQRVIRPGGRVLLQMGGHGNCRDFFDVVTEVIRGPEWRGNFKGFKSPYHFYHTDDYAHWLPIAGLIPRRIELIPKVMRHENIEGLKGWFRTTWFPYIDCVPETKHKIFIDTIVDHYLHKHPVDEAGRTSVQMVRLEVEASV